MLRIRYWALLLGVILLINAVLIFVNADGQVEGYVSSAICLLAGIANVIYAFWRRSDPLDSRRDGSAREPSTRQHRSRRNDELWGINLMRSQISKPVMGTKHRDVGVTR